MSAIKEIDRRIDVICQNCRDGQIIPLKLRLTDEDQEVQQYLVKQYRELTLSGVYTMPNGATVTREQQMRNFECKIDVINRERTVRIFYNPKTQVWMLSPDY